MVKVQCIWQQKRHVDDQMRGEWNGMHFVLHGQSARTAEHETSIKRCDNESSKCLIDLVDQDEIWATTASSRSGAVHAE